MAENPGNALDVNILELTLLYDFYGELLTKKQRAMFELHYLNDFSLNETAENFSVSRQAVFDILKRVKATLFDYEKKLGIVKTNVAARDGIAEIAVRLENYNSSSQELAEICGQLRNIAEAL